MTQQIQKQNLQAPQASNSPSDKQFFIFSETSHLRGYASSMQGGRPENQDDLGFLDTPLGFVFVLCDGMGGGPAGKTASLIVKHAIAKSLSECNSLTPPRQALCDAFCKANEAICDKTILNPSLKGMGSTALVLLLHKNSAFVAHTGDSRLYYLSENKLFWRSLDHSLVGELVQKGSLTEEEARTSTQSNIITRALGTTSNHNPDIHEIPYGCGDRFILCTDGVWGSMDSVSLVRKFCNSVNCDIIVNSLQDEIDLLGNRGGGTHDNHSIAVIDILENSQKKVEIMKKLRTIIYILASLIVVLCAIYLVLLINIKKQENSQAEIKNYTEDYISELRDKIADLMEENQLLNKNNQELNQEIKHYSTAIDSLKLFILKQNHSLDSLKTSQNKSQDNNKEESYNGLKAESIDILNKIIKCKKENQSDATRAIDNHYKDIIKKLREIKSVASSRNKQNGIERIISKITKNEGKGYVEKKKDSYQPTYMARKFAEECIELINKL